MLTIVQKTLRLATTHAARHRGEAGVVAQEGSDYYRAANREQRPEGCSQKAGSMAQGKEQVTCHTCDVSWVCGTPPLRYGDSWDRSL